MATSLPFILLDSMGFLPFVPKTSPTIFWFLVGISLGLYPLTHWLPSRYLLLRVCLLNHSSFQDKTPYFISPPPLSTLPKWIRIGGSLFAYPYGMHQVAPTHCFLLLGEMPSQQGIFLKRSLNKNLKIESFSPHHQTTLSESLDQGLTSPVLAEYK